MRQKGCIIAIDGPAAAGKGTIAPLLAKKLQGYHLYTGSMYRCVTLYCLEHEVDITNEEAVVATLSHIKINFKGDQTFLNGTNVTERMLKRDIDIAVPTVSNYFPVRQAMIKQQQRIGEEKVAEGEIVIAEGRDIGTKVFPQAQVKVYLTAKPEIRAKRRLRQLHERGVTDMTYDAVLQETIMRDEQDTQGSLGKLVTDPRAYGYHVIDDTDESEGQTMQEVLNLLKEKQLV